MGSDWISPHSAAALEGSAAVAVLALPSQADFCLPACPFNIADTFWRCVLTLSPTKCCPQAVACVENPCDGFLFSSFLPLWSDLLVDHLQITPRPSCCHHRPSRLLSPALASFQSFCTSEMFFSLSTSDLQSFVRLLPASGVCARLPSPSSILHC